MNAASRVIDGAAEGKDGKRHELLRATGYALRAATLVKSPPSHRTRGLDAAPVPRTREGTDPVNPTLRLAALIQGRLLRGGRENMGRLIKIVARIGGA